MVGQRSGIEFGSGQKACLSKGLPMDFLHVDQIVRAGIGNGIAGLF
jgi:hypothetical protein